VLNLQIVDGFGWPLTTTTIELAILRIRPSCNPDTEKPIDGASKYHLRRRRRRNRLFCHQGDLRISLKLTRAFREFHKNENGISRLNFIAQKTMDNSIRMLQISSRKQQQRMQQVSFECHRDNVFIASRVTILEFSLLIF
jgi:hypothetical protein